MTALGLVVPNKVFTLQEKVHDGRRTSLWRGTSDDEPCLIKILKPNQRTADGLARLNYEFDLTSPLTAPQILRPSQRAEVEGTTVLVYPQVPGEALKRLLSQRQLTIPQIFSLAVQLAHGLDAVHRAGIIHKDINPHNLLVDAQAWTLHVLDFAIATRLSREEQEFSHLAHLEGTLDYMSPEQTGRVGRSLDLRTDFFSMGATLYEMITGKVPFSGIDTAERVHQILAVTPPAADQCRDDCPAMLAAVVQKLLAKSPDDRYSSAVGILKDLERCQQSYHDQGLVPTFTLGLDDQSNLFTLPSVLYGREEELKALLAAYGEVAIGKNRFVAVVGASGIGKTALAAALKEPVTARRGFYVAAKFDQLQRNIPFSAVVSALEQLLTFVLLEDETSLSHWRQKIGDALAANAPLLAELLPMLGRVLDLPPPTEANTGAPIDGSRGVRQRAALKQLVATIASPSTPLTILLDDLQWADTASLEVLEVLAGEGGPAALLILGAYRDNEVGPSHPTMLSLARIAKVSPVLQLNIGALSTQSVSEFVAAVLHCPPYEAGKLGELVRRKTGGNPFYIRSFLRYLYEQGHFNYSFERCSWEWNADELQRQAVTENMVTLLVERLASLPENTRLTVGLAAAIGRRFDLQMLAALRHTSATAVLSDLWHAVAQGFIIPTGSAYKRVANSAADGRDAEVEFRFEHDKVQEAAYAMEPAAVRCATRRRIGFRLLDALPLDVQQSRMFEIADHLNASGLGDLDRWASSQKARAAAVNAAAGHQALAASAFAQAADYYLNALALTDSSEPKTGGVEGLGDELALIQLGRARCHLALGQIDAGLAHLSELLPKLRKERQRTEAYRLKAALHQSRGDHQASISCCIEGLGHLGVHLSFDVSMPAIALRIARFRYGWHGKLLAFIAGDQSFSETPHWSAVMSLVNQAIPSAYTINQNFFVALLLTVSERALKAGIRLDHPAFTMCLAQISIIFKDRATALKLRDHAYRQLERQPFAANATLFHVVAGHWCDVIDRPMAQCVRSEEKAYAIGIEKGDLGMSGVAAFMSVLNAIGGGLSLGELVSLGRRLEHFFGGKPESFGFAFFYSVLQTARAFAGLTSAPDSLATEDLSEEQLATYAQSNPGYAAMFGVMRAWLDLDSGRYQRAVSKARRNPVLIVLPGCFSGPLNLTVLAVSSIRLAASQGHRRLSPLAWLIVKGAQHETAWWGRNYLAAGAGLGELIRAEHAALGLRSAAAAMHYQKSLEQTRAAKNFYWEVFASEALGRLYKKIDLPGPAAYYLQIAIDRAAHYGMVPKEKTLASEFDAFIGAHTPLAAPTVTTAAADWSGISVTNATGALDLESLLKAAQAIAARSDMKELAATILKIMMVNAGATDGALLTRNDQTFEARLSGHLQDGELLVNTAEEMRFDRSAEGLMNRAAKTVALTGAPLILNQVATSDFRRDLGPIPHAPKSLLCLPIVIMGQVDAQVYLTNDVAEHCFNGERVKTMRILAAQAAIALQHAGYLKNLEENTQKIHSLERTSSELASLAEERAKTMAEQEERLATSAKLSAIGAMAGEMAHEINNPLAVIFGKARKLRRSVGDGSQDTAAMVKDVELVERTAMRISRIIKGIRSVARDGRSDPFESASVSDLLEETLELCHAKARDQRVEFTMPQTDATLTFECRAVQIGQVLINLVNNAFDAVSTLSERWVRVEVESTPSELIIRIVDSGKGIPLEIQEKMLRPYFTTKDVGKGTGMGVSISRRLIEAHHGTLTIDGACANTCFVITLPRQQPKSVEPPNAIKLSR